MTLAKRLIKPLQPTIKSKVSRYGPKSAASPAKIAPQRPSKPQTPKGASDGTKLPPMTESPTQISKQLEPRYLNFYKVTDPPNTLQLKHAHDYFSRHKPTLLASFPEFRLFPNTSAPEVCFLGRSNVGKSSLINALFRGWQRDISAHVSKKAGRTKTMNAFAVGPSTVGLKTHGTNKAGQVVRWESAPKQWVGKGGLILTDLQGYGMNSEEKWGTEIMKLLTKRKQLRRAFVLIDTSVGLKDNDMDLLQLLRSNAVPHQIVLTKADKLLLSGSKVPSPSTDLGDQVAGIKQMQEQMWKLFTDRDKWPTTGQNALCDILVTIADKDMPMNWRLGIDSLRFAVLQAAGLDCDRHGRRGSTVSSFNSDADSVG